MVQSRAKRLKGIQQKIIHLVLDPNEVDHTKKVLDDKDKEIMVIKRRLKTPKSYLVQTTKLITTSQEKE